MTSCAVETRELSHTYPTGVNALVNVNFCAPRGELVAVLGASGSGKTTLLRHFNGSLKPTLGKVVIDGRDLDRNAGDWVYKTAGFVFQDPNDQLFAATVGEDIAFGPRNMGLPPDEIEARVKRYLAWAGMSGWESRPISTLSFGQKRRVAIAGVLAMSPKVIVLDEPTAGLDPQAAGNIMSLLQDLCRRDTISVIIATHDVDLIPPYADRVYILENGRVAAAGKPDGVFALGELIHRSGLRPPRAAQALHLVSQELGHSLIDTPMTMDKAIVFGGHELGGKSNGKSGFTTGAAAAAAARAATEMLVHGRKLDTVQLRTTMGMAIHVPVAAVAHLDDGAAAEVIRDSGEHKESDPTHGVRIIAAVRLTDRPGVVIDGGSGVGRAMVAGLPVPPGEAAINPMPKQMIADAVGDVIPTGKGLEVIISVPDGEAIAARTMNPMSGIEGGIAILGTTGSME